jgi:TetR/AcrR family transcriptional regulator, transcriptional repressor for nem operon
MCNVMNEHRPVMRTRGDARRRLLDAAVHEIRARGYAATAVDDICRAAGVTKGAFFHHFASKEELAVAAIRHFQEFADAAFAAASYHSLPDPVDRLLGYVDLRRAILAGDLLESTCLLGTIVQEAYDTHPAIREACDVNMSGHIATIEADVAAAIEATGIAADASAMSLAHHIQAVIQGALILAKVKGSTGVAIECLDHLRRYLERLFERPEGKGASAANSKATGPAC